MNALTHSRTSQEDKKANVTVMLEVKDLLSEFIKQSAQQRTTPGHTHMAGGESDTTFSSTSTGSDSGIDSKHTNKQISLNIRVSILSKFCLKLFNHISQQGTRRVYNTLIEEKEFSGWNLSEQLAQYKNCWYNQFVIFLLNFFVEQLYFKLKKLFVTSLLVHEVKYF